VHTGWLGHCWSLAVEEQFYLVWPWIILFAPRKSLRWVIAGAILIGPLFRAWLEYKGLPWDMKMLTPACLDTLGLGGLLALVVHEGAADLKRTMCRIGLWVGVPLILFVCLQQNLQYLPKLGLRSLQHALDADRRSRSVLFDIAIGLFSVWLIGTAAGGFKGAIGSVLNFPFLHYIGRISYGMYLFHSIVQWLLFPLFVRQYAPDGSRGLFAVDATAVRPLLDRRDADRDGVVASVRENRSTT
jgi:peptidoglycan/LPS O-acetylase OafA/YrhL